MTVRELLERLRAMPMPQDIEVIVDSYEDGLDPVTDVEQVGIIDYPNRQPYYGIYDNDHNHNPIAKPAIRIFSKRRGEEVGYGE